MGGGLIRSEKKKKKNAARLSSFQLTHTHTEIEDVCTVPVTTPLNNLYRLYFKTSRLHAACIMCVRTYT